MNENYDSPDIENQVDNIVIDIPPRLPASGPSSNDLTRHEHHSSISRNVNCGTERNSIPDGISNWYSHKSFKIIVCAGLSATVICCSFGGLFSGRIDSCEVLGISATVISMWMPSPLTVSN